MKNTFLLCALIFFIQLSHAQDSTYTVDTVVLTKPEALLKVYPLLFQQTAAEYRALCYQAFNTATFRLGQIPKRKFRKGKLALITDLDETIVDNSYSDAKLLKEGKEYSSQSWAEWVSHSAATAVPGAVEFLQWAKKRGVTIFYISNRETSAISATLFNLQKLQLPDADTSHMLFLKDVSSKEARRQLVAQRYNVVMLMGDNLNDFTQAFEKKSIGDRFAETDLVKEEWGKKFIVLPNAVYGEWENALFEYNRGLLPVQKTELLLRLLKGY